ncbi:hypothetical protein niasHT_012624 [Heterodera trifolii]|uniref:Secreted protein n=1 Tax=Heterodera trifolii TaxID=157864 RepID=A0ABD2L2D1_9BILA
MVVRLRAAPIAVILDFAAFVFAMHANNDLRPTHPKRLHHHIDKIDPPPISKIPSWMPPESDARPAGRSAAAVGASAALRSVNASASGRASAAALPISLASA